MEVINQLESNQNSCQMGHVTMVAPSWTVFSQCPFNHLLLPKTLSTWNSRVTRRGIQRHHIPENNKSDVRNEKSLTTNRIFYFAFNYSKWNNKKYNVTNMHGWRRNMKVDQYLPYQILIVHGKMWIMVGFPKKTDNFNSWCRPFQTCEVWT